MGMGPANQQTGMGGKGAGAPAQAPQTQAPQPTQTGMGAKGAGTPTQGSQSALQGTVQGTFPPVAGFQPQMQLQPGNDTTTQLSQAGMGGKGLGAKMPQQQGDAGGYAQPSQTQSDMAAQQALLQYQNQMQGQALNMNPAMQQPPQQSPSLMQLSGLGLGGYAQPLQTQSDMAAQQQALMQKQMQGQTLQQAQQQPPMPIPQRGMTPKGANFRSAPRYPIQAGMGAKGANFQNRGMERENERTPYVHNQFFNRPRGGGM